MKQYIGIVGGIAILALSFNACGGGGGDTALADSTGLPGDHFNLVSALNIFKESSGLGDFEKKINTRKYAVNNLDLNGDKKTDYLRVKELEKGNSHLVIIQVPISQTEAQDVAVISIWKAGKNKAFVQIKGNEMLYGDSAVFAPSESGSSLDAGLFIAPVAEVAVSVNVWGWPIVPVLFAPAYVVYQSPVVVWNLYPAWYQTWEPYPYGRYRSEIAHMHKRGFAPVYVIQPTPALVVYGPAMNNSVFVVNRYQQFYATNGWPKSKGKPYYTPAGPVYHFKEKPVKMNQWQGNGNRNEFFQTPKNHGNPKQIYPAKSPAGGPGGMRNEAPVHMDKGGPGGKMQGGGNRGGGGGHSHGGKGR